MEIFSNMHAGYRKETCVPRNKSNGIFHKEDIFYKIISTFLSRFQILHWISL